MEIQSVIQNEVPGGFLLATTLDGEPIAIYVVVADPDLELLAQIVPADTFSSGAEVHASVVAEDEDIEDKLLEVIDNMNPNDVAVFLCASEEVLSAILDALGITEEE